MKGVHGAWEAILENGSWAVRDKSGRKIAVVAKGRNAKANARLIAATPYALEALKGLVAPIGDEDLEDNGEFSGAAICDMADRLLHWQQYEPQGNSRECVRKGLWKPLRRFVQIVVSCSHTETPFWPCVA